MPNKDVKIADVSHWRWPTPITAVKAADFSALIAKATEGTGWIDDRYDDFQAAAAEEDVLFGSFHYWRAAYDPVKQAKHYFDIATSRGRPFMPPVLDLERTNNKGVLSLALASARAKILVEETAQLWGEKPWIYTSYYAWKELFGNPSWGAEYPLWVASYRNDAPAIPVGWKDYIMWQFTESYKIPGASFAGYDANWFYGTQQDWTSFVRARQPAPPPTVPAFPFAGEVTLDSNIIIFDQPTENKIGLLPNRAGVYVREEVRDAEGIAWYKLGDGSFCKAKYITALPLAG